MFFWIRIILIALLIPGSAARVWALSVQDEQGTFTINTVPQRVVVLELSFADALAAIDISPVGIADDGDASRILDDVRARMKPWQSVGTRAQPSLEAISALKPDLIIADSSRHAGIYQSLKGIAPVLLLKSRSETYEENLQSAAIIGRVLGKEPEMERRLKLHRQRMADFAARLPHGANVVFGTSREQQFNLHSTQSYTGSVLSALGLKVPQPVNNSAMTALSLEQLLALNPDWLIVAHYREESVVKRWQGDSLWQMMTAAQKHQVASVDSNIWARMRGIFAAELIGRDAVKIFHHQPVNSSQ